MTNPGIKRVLNYLWDSEPLNLDHNNQIVCLGVKYDPVVSVAHDENDALTKGSNGADRNHVWPLEFLEDVESKVWLTYRTNFALIPKAKDGPSPLNLGSILRGSSIDLNGFTSDVGWGCMIRTSQSLLANALVLLKLGREWRKSDELLGDKVGDKLLGDKESEIISLFTDEPEAPFSLHNIVQHGEEACGKMPGEWFGPSAAASCIKYLCEKNDVLQVYISEGSDLYSSDFLSIAKNDGDFKPTFILLGLRLGIDNVNSLYWDSIKEFFNSPQMVGIAGGRPSASHYFYGYQGDNLFYLDPHTPRHKLGSPVTAEELETVHTKRIRLLRLDQMDPSMLVGFLIKNEEDWNHWRSMIETRQKIIHIFEAAPTIVRRPSISIDDAGGFVEFTLDEDEVSDGEFKESCENGHFENRNDEMEADENIANPTPSAHNIQESIAIEMPVPESPVMICRSMDSEYQLSNAVNSDDDYDTPILVSTSTSANPSPAIQDRERLSQEPVYVESPLHDDSEWEEMKR
jgi:cysteine protease ATG4